MVKNPLANAGDPGGLTLVPGSGKFPWSKKWQPTPVSLPKKFHGQKKMEDYSPWGCKESDVAKWLHTQNNVLEFPNLHIFSILVIYGLSGYNHSDRSEVISHCDFDLHFSDKLWYWATFHIHFGHLYVFLGKTSIEVLLPIFKWSDLSVGNWIVCLTCVFEYLPLSGMWFANTFSHSVGCLFTLLIVSVTVQKLSSLM